MTNLEEIFLLQKALMLKLNAFEEAGDKNEVMLSLTRAMIHECVEIERELKWKPWEKIGREIEWGKVVEESIDVFHFSVEMLIILGMTPENLLEAYRSKNEINLKRAEEEFVPFSKEKT